MPLLRRPPSTPDRVIGSRPLLEQESLTERAATENHPLPSSTWRRRWQRTRFARLPAGWPAPSFWALRYSWRTAFVSVSLPANLCLLGGTSSRGLRLGELLIQPSHVPAAESQQIHTTTDGRRLRGVGLGLALVALGSLSGELLLAVETAGSEQSLSVFIRVHLWFSSSRSCLGPARRSSSASCNNWAAGTACRIHSPPFSPAPRLRHPSLGQARPRRNAAAAR